MKKFLLGLGMLATTLTTSAVDLSDDFYRLAPTIQEGNTLQCFCWTFNEIRSKLPDIAEAGFSSVQTSPAQTFKASNHIWYYFYQPLDLAVGDTELGTKEELRLLCEEAAEYGIKVIVDIVANHLASQYWDDMVEDLKDNQYWHTLDGSVVVKNWSDREEVTHKCLDGLRDINSEDPYVQSRVKAYVQELKSIGVSGLRWDAAKHIGLPSEGCDFFPNVLDSDMYNLGEILTGPMAAYTLDNNYILLMQEYASLMSITDDVYGKSLRSFISYKDIVTGQPIGQYSMGWLSGSWYKRVSQDGSLHGIPRKVTLYWGESHDDWSNSSNGQTGTTVIDQNIIDRVYAIGGSQDKARAMYFPRPTAKINTQIKIGGEHSEHYKDWEVKAVNHFHNQMLGQKDTIIGDPAQMIYAVCREKGLVVVDANASPQAREVEFANPDGFVAPGTYTDEVNGSTWEVTSTTIRGSLGWKGIAVVFDTPIAGVRFATDDEYATIDFDGTFVDIRLSSGDADVSVYTPSGVRVLSRTTHDGTDRFALDRQGVYIIKVGDTSKKVIKP